MSGPVRIEKLPSKVVLTWVNERTLEMVLANNATYKIPLASAKNIPGVVVPCLFSGTIDGDPESVVSVSGCKDKDTEVVIGSKKIVGGLADLFLSAGETYQINLHYPRRRIGGADDALVSGPGADDNIVSQIAPRNGPLPRSVILEISLRYDNSLLAQFGNDPTRVKYWLSSVVELAKPKMSLIDLKVELRIVGTVEHFNENIQATEYWIHKISSTENKGVSGPISYFSAGKSANVILPFSHFIQALGMALHLLALLATSCQATRSTLLKKGEPYWQPQGPWFMSSDITSGCSEWKQT